MNRQAALDEVAVGGSALSYHGQTAPTILGDRHAAECLVQMAGDLVRVIGASAINTRSRPVLSNQAGAIYRHSERRQSPQCHPLADLLVPDRTFLEIGPF